MFSAVDCVTSSYCVVTTIGWDANTGVPETQLMIWDGTAWNLHGAAPGAAYWSVDCVAVDQCVLLGEHDSGTYDGTTITALPPRAEFIYSPLARASLTMCFAYSDGGALGFDGTAFAPLHVTGGGQTFWGSSGGCAPTGTTCIAGGGDADFNGGVKSLWLYNGSAWSNSLAVPANTVVKGSCGGPALCVAVTNNGRGYVWNGTSWTGPRTSAHGT